jgi:hypothetical protein
VVVERPTGLGEVLGELAGRGWITGPEPYGLTAEGEAAHAALGRRVGRARARIAEGVTAEEYSGTIDVLRRMAENLRRPVP